MNGSKRAGRWLRFTAAVAVLGGVTAGLACLIGCATEPKTPTLETVGPIRGGFGFYGDPNGYLQVSSATQTVNDGGIRYFPHTPYSIYTPEGRRVKGVINHAGEDDQRPMRVALPPGNYVVYAQAAGVGRVAVPVAIARSRLTLVYLGAEGMPKTEMALAGDVQFVRLPDGRVIGVRAAEPRN